jgi:hypothetical protein
MLDRRGVAESSVRSIPAAKSAAKPLFFLLMQASY